VAGLVDSTWGAIGNPVSRPSSKHGSPWPTTPACAEIGPVVAEFAALVTPDAITSILTGAERRDFFITARETMLGLALGRATNGGKPLRHERRVLARIRAEATTLGP
jgi:hypothetical protein